MCDVVEGQQADRKFNSLTMELSSALSCKANTDWESRSDDTDVININSNMPDYFRSSTDREANKRPSQLIMQRIQNELSDFLTEAGFLLAHLDCRHMRASSCTKHPLGGWHMWSRSHTEKSQKDYKAADCSTLWCG